MAVVRAIMEFRLSKLVDSQNAQAITAGTESALALAQDPVTALPLPELTLPNPQPHLGDHQPASIELIDTVIEPRDNSGLCR